MKTVDEYRRVASRAKMRGLLLRSLGESVTVWGSYYKLAADAHIHASKLDDNPARSADAKEAAGLYAEIKKRRTD